MLGLGLRIQSVLVHLCVSAIMSKKVTLKSSDGETFEIDEAVAFESQTIKDMLKEDFAESVIQLPNVTGAILAKVLEYCKKHIESPITDEELKSWDAEFVKVDQSTMFDLMMAAHFLNIKSLLDLTCQTVADMIKEKTVEEVREFFDIKGDFTLEEEEEIRRENWWAFK